MELSQKISFKYKDFEYLIFKTTSEYIIDEPCGGGKSINYRFEKGIPLKYFKNFEDENYINIELLNKIEEKTEHFESFLMEYEYNYIWELGFNDKIFLLVLKDFSNNIIKYSFSQYENSLRKLSPKL